MKQYILSSLKLTVVMIVICAVAYPLLIAGIGKFSAGDGNGEKIMVKGNVVGYANIGQKFTEDKYFWGRPSAVDYNAAGSAGSNKGPSNPDYLKTVQDRIDSFLVHNPFVRKKDIPSEMVTASGSGLDPDISIQSALIQIKRISKIRDIDQEKLINLVYSQEEKPLVGLFGPSRINVLKLNIALNNIN